MSDHVLSDAGLESGGALGGAGPGGALGGTRQDLTDRKLPPVTEVAIASMALIVIGGIWIASHLPKHVPLALPAFLLAASASLIVVNVVSLTRVPDFNWAAFFAVAKWAGLAYAITAGLLEWVFVKDGTSGGQLVVLTLSLVVYAVHVPLLIGFTVARYQPLDEPLRNR